MELLFPHKVEYKFSGSVSVDEVIGTLHANSVVVAHLGTFLEELTPGLRIQDTQLRVTEISEGSLKELFTIALIAVYQKELDAAVPPLISHVTGYEIPSEYNSLVTYSFLLLLYFGADFIHKYAIEKVDNTALREQVDVLISELSRATGNTESQIKRAIEKKFGRKSVVVALGKAALHFFHPSRRRNDDPIIVDEMTIAPEVIKSIPKNVNIEALDDDRLTKEYIGVDVEVRATDFDKANQGWAGIVKEVHPKRLTMRLMPGIDPEKLRDQKHVKGDIIMLFKDRNGSLKPSSFHLERIHDDVDIIGGDKPPGRPGAKKGEAKGGEA